ncbi:hypothetical protein [Pseudomonas sp. NPDC089734]|uniref:hypothetical protein n=1 Tax=Pseudomonas sp. NPDC089734 TaxID=3364469 RepID=UPI00381227E5
MTTINTSSLSAYSSALTLTVKNKDADSTTATDAAEKSGVSVSLDGAKVGGTAVAAGAGAGGSSSSSTDETIEKLKEQIEQTEKLLAQQQAQLAAAQNGKGSEDEKAQRVMAIQMQIATTTATLQTQQGALLQLTTSGGIDTTA